MPAKKKLSKKEKARLEAEQAELLRIEMEKEKQRKLEEERERKQREREEAEKRQKQEIIENRIRRQQLKESILYFENIKVKIDKIREDEVRQKEWEHFMRCNGLPNAQNPGDLRKYIHMWCTTINNHKTNERNWLLKTNERTVLTQDRDIADLTRENLRKQQGNLGDTYSNRVEEILGILSEVEESIKDTKLSKAIINDLQRLKFEFRNLLSEYIDDFTYSILSHVTRDMESDSPGIAKQLYESNVFKTQVWTLQGESQMNQRDKFKDESKHFEIEFPLLELQLQLPPTVKVANSAIRGLWLNYDHFSDYSPSFIMPNITQKHLNILQQTKKEWKKRKEILQSTLDEATKATPTASFDSMDQPESRVVDVDKVYTEYEDDLNKKRRKDMGPDSLHLSEHDVNLRSHRIISGVFCINCLEQPQQDKRLNPRSFIRTIVSPNKLTTKGFYQSYKPPPPPLPGIRRLPEEIEAEMKMVERNLDKLGMITLQLPDTVLWFEPPIVCRWETYDDAKESELEEGIQAKDDSFVSKSKKRKSICTDTKSIKEVVDFDMCNIPHNIDIYGLMMNFIAPRLPNGYCVRIEYKKKDRQNSILRYLTRSDSTRKLSLKKLNCTPIKETLIETDSPRPFHPRIVFRKILHIKEAKSFQTDYCSDTHDDVNGSGQKYTKPYMFSQLIADLDDIYDLQTPFLDQQLIEINSNLSSSITSPQESPSRRFSGMIIIRESDIQKKDSLKKSQQADIEEAEESGSEYEDEIETDADKYEGKDPNGEIEPGRWSTRDVHDAKFNEDKLSIQFRIGRLGHFGFAANRYSNIPYQTWEIKPDFKIPWTVSFSLTAAVISLEMQISNEGFCVNTFQGGTTVSLTEMIGKTVSLEDLKKTLTSSAVDIFPDEDAFCYTEGSCEKNYVMEMHLYNCMSQLALSHNFSWSRWNLLSGSRTAVLLMRELLENKKIPNHSTLYVTPLKASVVDCTEVSASFSTIGIPGMEYYADLYNLALVHCHPSSKEKQLIMDPVLRDNVAQILMSTRPLSFC